MLIALPAPELALGVFIPGAPEVALPPAPYPLYPSPAFELYALEEAYAD